MDIIWAIRAGIVATGGLFLVLAPTKAMKIQDYVFKKLHIKYRDSKRATIIAGVIFLIISIILFIVALNL